MRSVINRSHLLLAGLGLSLCVSSCNLAPTYETPKVAVPAAYKAASNQGWVEAQPKDTADKGQWWKIYNDPVLDSLEDQVNRSNLSLDVAAANFSTSRALALQARASLFPVANLVGAITRQGASKHFQQAVPILAEILTRNIVYL